MRLKFVLEAHFECRLNLLCLHALHQTKDIINQFVDKVVVFKDKIVINFNFDDVEDTTGVK